MNLKLSGKVQTAIAAGATAIAIAGTMLSGNDGLEGRRYTPYFDVAGVLTVCDGHTGKDIIGNKKYSDSECDAFLRADLKTVADGIDPLIKVSLPETTRAALYSFTFNVGVGAFKKSTLLVKLNQGDIAGACDQLHRWVYAGGKPWKGLMNRREVEHAVCTWPQHEIPLVEVDGKLTAVEPPRQPDPARWFVLVVGGLMAGLVAGMGYTLWKLRQLMRTKDREPRPNDNEND